MRTVYTHRFSFENSEDAVELAERTILPVLQHHGLSGLERTAFTATLDADNKVYGARLHADYSTGVMSVRVYACGNTQSQREFAENVGRDVSHAIKRCKANRTDNRAA